MNEGGSISAILIMAVYLLGVDFPVCVEPGDQYYPAAIFANGEYYVFWNDLRTWPVSSTSYLYGARVDTAGNVLDPGGIELYGDSTATKPSVAHDGANLMVVFRNGC